MQSIKPKKESKHERLLREYLEKQKTPSMPESDNKEPKNIGGAACIDSDSLSNLSHNNIEDQTHAIDNLSYRGKKRSGKTII